TAKSAPSSRHSKRMRSLYVEPASISDWNRPAEVSATDAHPFLQDADTHIELSAVSGKKRRRNLRVLDPVFLFVAARFRQSARRPKTRRLAQSPMTPKPELKYQTLI